MDWEELLAELEKLARRLAVQVRYEPTAGRAGRCQLHGEAVIIMDSGYRVRDRADALGILLADYDTETFYLPETVRDFLDRRRGHGHPRLDLD